MLGRLRAERDEMNRQIVQEEASQTKAENEMCILIGKIEGISEALSWKTQVRGEYDQAIREGEAAYNKILESSQTLLHIIRSETVSLTKYDKNGEPGSKRRRSIGPAAAVVNARFSHSGLLGQDLFSVASVLHV